MLRGVQGCDLRGNATVCGNTPHTIGACPGHENHPVGVPGSAWICGGLSTKRLGSSALNINPLQFPFRPIEERKVSAVRRPKWCLERVCIYGRSGQRLRIGGIQSPEPRAGKVLRAPDSLQRPVICRPATPRIGAHCWHLGKIHQMEAQRQTGLQGPRRLPSTRLSSLE